MRRLSASCAARPNRNGINLDTQQYNAYGSQRGGGTLPTDHAFTGQKRDGTGLLYYSARYYDPGVGQFVSPDSIVPDPTNVLDYNRFMYTRGNPLKYNDPSGHCVWDLCIVEGIGLVELVLATAAAGTAVYYEYQYGFGPNAEQNRAEVIEAINDLTADVASFPIDDAVDMQTPGYVPVGSDEAEWYTTIATGLTLTTVGFPLVQQEIGSNLFESSSTTAIANTIADGHAWDKHVIERDEFPEIDNAADFAGLIESVMLIGNNKALLNDRHAYLLDDILVITDPNHYDEGTAYRPDNPEHEYNSLR